MPSSPEKKREWYLKNRERILAEKKALRDVNRKPKPVKPAKPKRVKMTEEERKESARRRNREYYARTHGTTIEELDARNLQKKQKVEKQKVESKIPREPKPPKKTDQEKAAKRLLKEQEKEAKRLDREQREFEKLTKKIPKQSTIWGHDAAERLRLRGFTLPG